MLRLNFLQSQPEFLSSASVFPLISCVAHWFEICGCHVCVKVIKHRCSCVYFRVQRVPSSASLCLEVLSCARLWELVFAFLIAHFPLAKGLYGFEAHRWSSRSLRKRILWCPPHTRAEEYRAPDCSPISAHWEQSCFQILLLYKKEWMNSKR